MEVKYDYETIFICSRTGWGDGIGYGDKDGDGSGFYDGNGKGLGNGKNYQDIFIKGKL